MCCVCGADRHGHHHTTHAVHPSMMSGFEGFERRGLSLKTMHLNLVMRMAAVDVEVLAQRSHLVQDQRPCRRVQTFGSVQGGKKSLRRKKVQVGEMTKRAETPAVMGSMWAIPRQIHAAVTWVFACWAYVRCAQQRA